MTSLVCLESWGAKGWGGNMGLVCKYITCLWSSFKMVSKRADMINS